MLVSSKYQYTPKSSKALKSYINALISELKLSRVDCNNQILENDKMMVWFKEDFIEFSLFEMTQKEVIEIDKIYDREVNNEY